MESFGRSAIITSILPIVGGRIGDCARFLVIGLGSYSSSDSTFLIGLLSSFFIDGGREILPAEPSSIDLEGTSISLVPTATAALGGEYSRGACISNFSVLSSSRSLRMLSCPLICCICLPLPLRSFTACAEASPGFPSTTWQSVTAKVKSRSSVAFPWLAPSRDASCRVPSRFSLASCTSDRSGAFRGRPGTVSPIPSSRDIRL